MRPTQLVRLGARRARQDLLEGIYLRTGCDRTQPYAIRGLPTKRCNHRCLYCGDWRQKADSSEMDLAQWKSALASLKSFIGGYVIQFSGGEPFLFRGFCDLLEFCRDQGIGAGVVTNGSALGTAMMRRVVTTAPTNIDISVDGTCPATHDQVRGAAGSFATIEAGIAELHREMAKQRISIPLRIKTTVHRANYRELPHLVRWCREIGATTISFQPVRHWTEEVARELWLDSETEIAALAQIAEQLVALQRQGAPIETPPATLRTWPDYFRHIAIQPGMRPCRVGLGDYHIQPNGDVLVCWLQEPIGNVKHRSAREIWYGEVARKLRRGILACDLYGHQDCALSCLARRPLRDELRRGLLMLKRSR